MAGMAGGAEAELDRAEITRLLILAIAAGEAVPR
jgi:hypothetical protein